jgi:hypothetical protein
MNGGNQDRMYPPGSKVRVLRGALAGQILTVRACSLDEIYLAECPKSQSMSKLNVEPIEVKPGKSK